MAAPKKQATKLPASTKVAETVAVDPTVVDSVPVAGDVKDNLPNVELEEEHEELTYAPYSPWSKVVEMSDEEMEVEAVNVAAAGLSYMLLRFRLEGRLTGQVLRVERMHYNPAAKVGKKFVSR